MPKEKTKQEKKSLFEEEEGLEYFSTILDDD